MAVVTVPPDLCITVNARLIRARAPEADRYRALAVLAAITGTLASQSYATRHTLTELRDMLAMDKDDLARAVAWLHRVGVVTLMRHHRDRRLGVIPPGAAPIGRPRFHAPADSAIAESAAC